ncbi:MAG: hypothetical protein ACJ74Q_24970 [Pyrinomonadaceae bacterium]
MKNDELIRCRVAACREASADADGWVFYLINDGVAPLDSAVLYRVSSEWGDLGNSKAADVRVNGLAPGAHAPIWQDDGEFRTELSLIVRAGGREVRLSFEFPKLYIQRNLSLLRGMDKHGWEEIAEG